MMETLFILHLKMTVLNLIFMLNKCVLCWNIKIREAAVTNNVSTKNRFKIKDIVVNYKLLYKNIQEHTMFINEVGLYELNK